MTGKALLARRNVAATEHPLASLAAVEAMREGGNAFDAAAAASFALSVVQPHLNGLGGDFFALLYSAADGKVYCLNTSGWAPASADLEKIPGGGRTVIPRFGPGSVVVPGLVRGVFEMQKRFGRFEFSTTMRSAVDLAENGFPAGPGFLRSLAMVESSLSKGARGTYLRDGMVPAVGGIIKQRELARCLLDISLGGPDAFYSGYPARTICEELSLAGLDFEEDDFSAYEAEWCEPLKMDYNGTDVFEMPPNSMGATTLLILKLLQELELGRLKPNSSERIKLMVEAAKEAYSARDLELGDPRFVNFDLASFLKAGRANRKQKKIEEADTTYFAIADEDGNLLSCIQSLFHHFGSRVYVERCGFFLNNRGSAFKTGGPNKLEPRKRPVHTLSSLILSRNGKPFIATGCSGGDFRPQQHALLITDVVDFGMNLETAINFPRFLWDGADGITVEEGYTGLARLAMRKKVVDYPGATGVAQGAEVLDESLKGVCDIRGEGLPVGS